MLDRIIPGLCPVGVSLLGRCWYIGGYTIVTGGPMGPCRRKTLGQNRVAGAGVGSGGGAPASEDCRAFGAEA
jgi:hypothetical protein